MGIDSFVFKVIILLMPGISGLMLYKRVAVRRQSKKGMDSLKDLFSVIMISVVSSALYDLGLGVINRIAHGQHEGTFGKLVNTEMFQPNELFAMMGIAILLSVGLAAVENKKLIYRIARKIRITTHYGDDDVWTFINNSPDTSWIFVRDHRLELVYYGLIEQYSDPGEDRELLLSDVSVYTNDTGEELYKVDKLYICRDSNELTIEIPNVPMAEPQNDDAPTEGKKNAEGSENKAS